MSISVPVISKAFGDLGLPSVKPEQLEVVAGFLKRDVFVVLPTGFGKSACYQCLPLVYDANPTIVLVVTPLTAIMKDQVTSLTRKGVKACYITGDQDDEQVKEGVTKGLYQIVYFTPEMLLGNQKWRKMLLDDVYISRLRAFVIDEAHTVIKWGETFRKLLLRVGEIRSLLPAKVHIMALTATATVKLRTEVARVIGMRDELVVSRSPCKDNLMYAVIGFSTIEQTFKPIAQSLLEKGVKCPRMIIYCRSYGDCSDLYLFFREFLGKDFTHPPGSPDLPSFRLLDMYMSCTEAVVKDEIVRLFSIESALRVVVATVAFGMGVDCPDVRQVISFGTPCDCEAYVQETGRAGRDHNPSLATLVKKNSGRRIEKAMIEYQDSDVCRRDTLFKNFDGYSRTFEEPLCLCCDLCSLSCQCCDCSANHASFVLLK